MSTFERMVGTHDLNTGPTSMVRADVIAVTEMRAGPNQVLSERTVGKIPGSLSLPPGGSGVYSSE
jgi:hypothetical protein